jgi:hypothetical protein
LCLHCLPSCLCSFFHCVVNVCLVVFALFSIVLSQFVWWSLFFCLMCCHCLSGCLCSLVHCVVTVCLVVFVLLSIVLSLFVWWSFFFCPWCCHSVCGCLCSLSIVLSLRVWLSLFVCPLCCHGFSGCLCSFVHCVLCLTSVYGFWLLIPLIPSNFIIIQFLMVLTWFPFVLPIVVTCESEDFYLGFWLSLPGF